LFGPRDSEQIVGLRNTLMFSQPNERRRLARERHHREHGDDKDCDRLLAVKERKMA
jgi:hypothetical protein